MMRMIAGAIVILAGAVLMAGGVVGGAGGRNSDVADVVVGFGVLVGLAGLGLLVWGIIEAALGRRLPGPNEALRPPGLSPFSAVNQAES